MTKKSTQVLQRHNLADAVVLRLQQQISLGQYIPGEKLPSEPALMEQFGVGRSTIREAIRILANTGVLSVKQGSGTYIEEQSGISEPLVQRLKRADTKDLDEVRHLLEVKVAEKAALNRTRKDIEKMQSFLKKRNTAARNGDLEEAVKADIQFHVAVATASRNDILADLYRTFAEYMSRHFLRTHQNTDTFVQTQQWHEALLKTIEEQDPKKAWQCATRIVNGTGRHES